jgi:uncharacterized protein YndB with AHSA1/START domain
MKNAGALKITTPSDCEIAMTRVFDAPRRLVWEALTKPELLKLWFYGPPGWSLPVCEMDLRIGGAYRWIWRGPDGTEMGMGGVFLDIVPPGRLVATESFDDPWYPGEAIDTTVLVEEDGKTTLTLTVRYDSRDARDGVLKSPMEQGVAANYDRLEEYFASFA